VRRVPTAAILSFRLGGTDGVSIEAEKWAGALRHLGWHVFSVAGAGPVDILLPGLAIDAPHRLVATSSSTRWPPPTWSS